MAKAQKRAAAARTLRAAPRDPPGPLYLAKMWSTHVCIQIKFNWCPSDGLMRLLNGRHLYFPLAFVAAFLIASCAPSTPEPTITPQMTTRQVIAAFRAIGIFVVDDTSTMSGTDYQGAPQICPGQHFTVMEADVGLPVLVLQCETSSRLNQLSDFYKPQKNVLTRGGTLIAVPANFLSRTDLQALDWQMQNCAQNNLCVGK